MKKELIVNLFDTETTGLCKPMASDMKDQPYIAELYVMKVIHRSDGVIEKIDELDTFLKPPIPLSDEITRITGITNDMIKEAPSFIQKYREIAEFFKGVDRMVAHNLSFDRNLTLFELARHNKQLMFPWPIEHVCTVERSMHIEQRRMSLINLHKHFFNEEFPAHRARNDVEAMFRCYKELVSDGSIK
jgi:DNA polymerase III alpha subunit (gram-positive type)